ncbi:hypothetical protein [Nostoc sp.]|uniref:hypothetical protein n=1 Tax=Nostoc sp. TaxID=1180 RepID=UPI002FF96F35
MRFLLPPFYPHTTGLSIPKLRLTVDGEGEWGQYYAVKARDAINRRLYKELLLLYDTLGDLPPLSQFPLTFDP